VISGANMLGSYVCCCLNCVRCVCRQVVMIDCNVIITFLHKKKQKKNLYLLCIAFFPNDRVCYLWYQSQFDLRLVITMASIDYILDYKMSLIKLVCICAGNHG
jgi:hypothetical protein